LEIEKQCPDLWVGEDEESSKNNFESELLGINLNREKVMGKYSYHKIIQARDGKALSESIGGYLSNPLTAIVYNFVDMLSHARTDMQMIRQLAPDESAYRDLTRTWFNHSSLRETLTRLARKQVKVVITTDHGTIRVKKPVKMIGDRNTNTNLRYKQGKNLGFDEQKIFYTRNPESLGLPKLNVSTCYAFAREDGFFAYPNNYNYYVGYYRDTFQHGGISLEEVIVPLITLVNK
ncbi:MAG: PglZ domain-containing protein, partial [Cyclobacteriaceae bacterium]|nr:PglZ domain-containing protein [Cyclobacteriaceae bacterium]